MTQARGTQKVRRRVAGVSRRPFFCSSCLAEVGFERLRCPNCGEWFHGWRDETGDRAREDRK